jgi:hypothetical protein
MRNLRLVAASVLVASSAARSDDVFLKSWEAPPYWAPPPSGEVHEPAQARRPASERQPLAGGPTALPFISLFPCRLVDTRGNGAPLTGGFLPSATVRSYTLTGVCNVPANAQAISLNATVVKPVGPGFLTLWPQGGAFPPVSTLNYLGNDVIVNGAVVPLSVSGGISIALGVSGGDVVLDTNGYYAPLPGVSSLNALSGDVVLAPGGSVTLTPSGNTLTIASTSLGGTVTSVASGSGLTGGPITAAGTLSVAPGGITSSMLANGAVGLAQIDPTQVQARGASTCPVGSTIQTLNADGSVVCAVTAPAPAGFSISILDPSNSRFASAALGTDGLVLVAYFQAGGANPVQGGRVAHCSNAGCTEAIVTPLVPDGVRGYSPSLTIGADGLGLMSQVAAGNTSLGAAHCSNVTCSIFTVSTLDAAPGAASGGTSITTGADGRGLIAYGGTSGGGLKVAHCDDAACTSAALSTLDSVGNVGAHPSVTIGADHLGLISYDDVTNGDLKVAHCSNLTCSAATLSTLDATGNVGSQSSIITGPDGFGLIAYLDVTNSRLKVAHCTNVTCSSATLSTLDSTGSASAGVATSTATAIGPDGFGLISYYDAANQQVKLAHCSNAACTSATFSTVDFTTSDGTSLVLGSDGLPLVVYATQTAFKAAHCANGVSCTPWAFRR